MQARYEGESYGTLPYLTYLSDALPALAKYAPSSPRSLHHVKENNYSYNKYLMLRRQDRQEHQS